MGLSEEIILNQKPQNRRFKIASHYERLAATSARFPRLIVKAAYHGTTSPPMRAHSLTLIAVSLASPTSALRHFLPSNSTRDTASALPPWFRLAVISVPPVRNRFRKAVCSAGTGV